MQLREEVPGTSLFVRRCEANTIIVVDRSFSASFVLAPDRVLEQWPVTDPAQLSAETIYPLLALEPAVVLLGTGMRLRFPPQAAMAEFLTRGIGIEAMDNAAAARTFNLLAGEGRRVIAAFMLPPAT
jgi:uncharacterized protein